MLVEHVKTCNDRSMASLRLSEAGLSCSWRFAGVLAKGIWGNGCFESQIRHEGKGRPFLPCQIGLFVFHRIPWSSRTPKPCAIYTLLMPDYSVNLYDMSKPSSTWHFTVTLGLLETQTIRREFLHMQPVFDLVYMLVHIPSFVTFMARPSRW